MTDARTEVLARSQEALGGSTATTADVVVPRGYRTVGELAPGSAEVLDLLEDRLLDYRAHVERVSPDFVPTVIAQVIEAVEAAGAVVVPHGLDPAWTSGLSRDVVVDARGDRTLTHAELDAAAAVVTAARVAIADTGTIVLDGEPDQGRRAISLVPDVHVCVVRADQVVHTVPDGVRVLAEHPERPQTWISGPSATSDIELQRVEGVHGPRTLHVLLVV